jgi:hypothetical protein
MVEHNKVIKFLEHLPSIYSISGFLFWTLVIFIGSILIPKCCAPVLADINTDIERR